MLHCPIAKLLKKKTCFFQADFSDIFLVSYKLLHDSLFLFSLFFAFMLIVEGLLPSLITTWIGFPKILFTIALNILGIKFLTPKITYAEKDPTPSQRKNGKVLPVLFFFFGTLLLFNAQRNINPWLNLVITLVYALIGWQFYRLFFSEEKSSDTTV